jgi:hypothetical protein
MYKKKQPNPNIKHVPRTTNRAFCGKLLSKLNNRVAKELVDLEDPDLCSTCRIGVRVPTFIKILLVWRPERHETGLARITESPRGATLYANGVEVANVMANRTAPMEYKGWFWVARNEASEKLPFEVPSKNTCHRPTDDLEVAKAECKAYMKRKLGEARDAFLAGSVQGGVQPALAVDPELTSE